MSSREKRRNSNQRSSSSIIDTLPSDTSAEHSSDRVARPKSEGAGQPPRFLECLVKMKEKGQRTVYRLTIVKAWNEDEAQRYAELVALGQPDFIEVKGVTFCGDSKASTLTMGNVPWHQEVINFVNALVDLLPDYALASEHEHSNSLLIANKKFCVDGQWNTWIDYERFHELIATGKPFTSADYTAPTPEWAVYGAKERGFDPVETRVFRKVTRPNEMIGGC